MRLLGRFDPLGMSNIFAVISVHRISPIYQANLFKKIIELDKKKTAFFLQDLDLILY